MLKFFNQHEHKLTIVKKQLSSNAQALRNLIESNKNDQINITYFVGSSEIDRQAVEDYVEKYHQFAADHPLVIWRYRRWKQTQLG